MEENIKSFLHNHSSFQLNENKTRVICTVTGHELPFNIAALESYANSKKYKQLTKNGTCDLSKVEEFKEYLIPSKKGKNKLFCLVTKKEINDIPSHIENHVTGRKFLRDLKIYKIKLGNEENTHDQGAILRKETRQETVNDLTEELDEELDDEMMEKGSMHQDKEFDGGVWLPEGVAIAGDSSVLDTEPMDIETEDNVPDKEEKIINSGKREKNMNKRKLKETKREKVAKGRNQKKKK